MTIEEKIQKQGVCAEWTSNVVRKMVEATLPRSPFETRLAVALRDHSVLKLVLATLIFLIACLVPKTSHAQQQPQYGMYMFNQFAYNPSYAGSREATQVSILYRDQWDNLFPGSPKTYMLSFNSPIFKQKAAAGLQIAGDQIGPKSSFGLLGTYAYRVRFGKSALAAGLRFGFFQYTYNINQIDYKDNEPIWEGRNIFQKTLPTADAGLFYNTRNFYLGLSLNQLIGGNTLTYNDPTGNNLTISKIKPHGYIACGYAFEIGSNLVFNPSIVLKTVENADANVDLNLNFLLANRVWVGTLIRSGYGLGIMAQVIVSKRFKVGYARDRGLDFMGGIGAARTNEFLLQYEFLQKKGGQMVSPKFL